MSFASGNLVGLDMCGKYVRDCMTFRKFSVGQWELCSSKFMLKSPIRMDLCFLNISWERVFAIISVKSSTFSCLLCGLHMAETIKFRLVALTCTVHISMSLCISIVYQTELLDAILFK